MWISPSLTSASVPLCVSNLCNHPCKNSKEWVNKASSLSLINYLVLSQKTIYIYDCQGSKISMTWCCTKICRCSLLQTLRSWNEKTYPQATTRHWKAGNGNLISTFNMLNLKHGNLIHTRKPQIANLQLAFSSDFFFLFTLWYNPSSQEDNHTQETIHNVSSHLNNQVKALPNIRRTSTEEELGIDQNIKCSFFWSS